MSRINGAEQKKLLQDVLLFTFNSLVCFKKLKNKSQSITHNYALYDILYVSLFAIYTNIF